MSKIYLVRFDGGPTVAFVAKEDPDFRAQLEHYIRFGTHLKMGRYTSQCIFQGQVITTKEAQQ